ncbi:MAG: PhnD/SsuA/transferrin family substrate-binding protein [Lentisphaeraceae bacterium]|nr:PhnD/SsuA/transferrin family substrate-binding protein [Lentisphaeraceae bacterium]
MDKTSIIRVGISGSAKTCNKVMLSDEVILIDGVSDYSAMLGIEKGTLDIVCTNVFLAETLVDYYEAEAMYYLAESDSHEAINERYVLLIKRPEQESANTSKPNLRIEHISFLKDTKNGRALLCGDPNSRAFVTYYLQPKIGLLKSWFSEVRYTDDNDLALRELESGNVDVITINSKIYDEILAKRTAYSLKYEAVWFSPYVPKAVVVVKKGVKLNEQHLVELLNGYLHDGEKWSSFKESKEDFNKWEYRVRGEEYKLSKSVLESGE